MGLGSAMPAMGKETVNSELELESMKENLQELILRRPPLLRGAGAGGEGGRLQGAICNGGGRGKGG